MPLCENVCVIFCFFWYLIYCAARMLMHSTITPCHITSHNILLCSELVGVFGQYANRIANSWYKPMYLQTIQPLQLSDNTTITAVWQYITAVWTAWLGRYLGPRLNLAPLHPLSIEPPSALFWASDYFCISSHAQSWWRGHTHTC